MMQDREFIFGWDPKSSKRSSGLFSVLKWFGNKESVSAPSPDLVHSPSSSCDSIESVFSTDTVASFNFVPPSSYKPFGTAQQAEKYILPGPETSTYRARLAQREVARETDQNLTLRSKYNLYKGPELDRGHSLPLMNKSIVVEQSGMHRRTASESSKHRRAGAYCHVKGKRKAPQPPGVKGENTLRRKKRMAPQPPNTDVICNDSLKLDHGILKPAKEPTSSAKTVIQVVQVSPRPWYKRTLSKSSTPEKKLPEQDKRKSGLSFLTNISELDREAMEIISKENLKIKYLKNTSQAPAFMRPKGSEHARTNSDSWISPKRKSARDLIAKFNAITGVSRGSNSVKEQTPPAEPEPKQEVIIPVVQEITPSSSQSEKKEVLKTTAVVKPISRSQWNCPKCTLENDYWRIICRVCSTIKPYFDDFTSISTVSSSLTETKTNSKDITTEKTGSTDLFGLGSVECRISDLQRSVFQSQYPKLSQNFSCTIENNDKRLNFDFKPEKVKIIDVSKYCLNIDDNKLKEIEQPKAEIQNHFQPQYPRISLNLNNENTLAMSKLNDKQTKSNSKQNANIDSDAKKKERNSKQVEKIILGDEIGFKKATPESTNKIETENDQQSSAEGKTKVEKMILGDEISVEKPDYVNINKYEKIKPDTFTATSQNKTQNIEKMILGDELSVHKSSTPKIETTPTKPKQTDEDKQATTKREEREKLKKMLIEMKNSLPKRVHKSDTNDTKRISLIQEQTEPEIQESEDENEKSAEVIVATTETVYENIKVKHVNVDKPLKISSSVQTNAILKRNPTEKETSGFHLIGAKDFVGISNEKTSNADGTYADKSTSYANLNVTGPKDPDPGMFAGCSATDTLEINRLLRRLETAIAGGELGHAAVFARELAQLKVPLSVIRHKQQLGKNKQKNTTGQHINVDMYVEDRQSHRGPFPLQVCETTTVSELKGLVEDKYKIPRVVQRWILGKQLATDDTATLAQHQVNAPGCPIFLYLVEAKPDSNAIEIVELIDLEPARSLPSPNTVYHVPIAIIDEDESEDIITVQDEVHVAPEDDDVQELWKCRACTLLNPVESDKCEVCGLIRNEEPAEDDPPDHQTYLQLVHLDNEDLVRNVDTFECLVCLGECLAGEGITLRECLHQFCRACLAHTVEFSSEPEVRCPYRDEQYSCELALQDREVKALVTATVYEQHLAKSVQQAETRAGADAFHCKTPDCTGWCVYEDTVNQFQCPVCQRDNCLTCQAIHSGMNCKQYQEQMRAQSETDNEARRTRDFLADMMSRGEALACPTCAVVLLKKWGCDWLRCSMCKTEICWVTRGPRWGPAGKGDTSAGCRCGVNATKCHPNCNYCH